MADQLNYFFKFPSFLAALIDPIVGPYLLANNTINPLAVYNIANNSVTPLKGYWCMVLTPARVTTLDNHPALQFLADRELEFSNPGSAVLINNIGTLLSTLQIVSWMGPYITTGLGGTAIPVSDWILATGFWQDGGFWRDQSAWID